MCVSIDEQTRDAFVGLLRSELVCALGCTEPIALAYAAALAGRLLDREVEHMVVKCSGNIIKNVKSVVVPNSGGLKGVEVAAVLGLIGGDPDRDLEVLESVTPRTVEQAVAMIAEGFCDVELIEDVPNLFIVAEVQAAEQTASVTVLDRHTNIVSMKRNGEELVERTQTGSCEAKDDPYRLLSMEKICAFAREVDLSLVEPILARQIDCNTAISDEGLKGHWGSEIGRTILAMHPADVTTRMRARAAAGSDARMGGCSLPVVINSGSGNQGMTVSLPVIEYAQSIHASREQLMRALCISNLTAFHLKHYIGSLSAFCGVVCAAAGAGAAVTYLAGGSDGQVGSTVVNTIANVGGIMCDGAKASCAAKISSSVDAAMLGHTMAMLGADFCAGDGLVGEDVESSIASMGYVGRVGMHETDIEILNIMIGKTRPDVICD